MDWLQFVAVIFGPAGACWAVLNGTRERVRNIDERTEKMTGQIAGHGERLARIETKLEDHL